MLRSSDNRLIEAGQPSGDIEFHNSTDGRDLPEQSLPTKNSLSDGSNPGHDHDHDDIAPPHKPSNSGRPRSCDVPNKPWPEDGSESCFSANFLRRQSNALFYSYMSPILRRGAKLHKERKAHLKHAAQRDDEDPVKVLEELSKSDVYTVPQYMESQHLANVFWKAQKQIQSRNHPKKKGRRGSSSSDNTNGNNHQQLRPAPSTWAFLKILYQISKPTYLPAAIWQFIAVCCQCSLPILVREVLIRLESHPGQNFRQEGLILAIIIFSVSLLEGIGNERQKFLSFQTGITLRSAVVSAAHGHVLSMTPRGRAGLTSGEITNLVAVDAQKLFELAQEGHYSWSCPLAMVIVSVLLLLEIGPAAIVGIVTMFLIVPMVQYVVKRMMILRKLRAQAADERVESISSMLSGIRFTKLNRYEERFFSRVMERRKREVRLLRTELFFLSLTIFATVASPVLASAFTFITYSLIGPDDGEGQHILTPSMTFTSLYLFAALRFPINYAGKFMGKAAQGFQACYRFAAFFHRESVWDLDSCEGNYDDAKTDRDDGVDSATTVDVEVCDSTRSRMPPIVDTIDVPENSATSSSNLSGSDTLIDVNASFQVGSSEASFTLSNIQLSVQRSQIVCVVGPVAAGKSTLVQGLIGEILPTTTTITAESSAIHAGQSQPYCRIKGRVSYASQIPFILNATVRDNILFGEPFHPDRYERVLEACCLKSDIEQFHSKDLTEIGERGVTLSGGQKQRLSLARVAYSQPDVAILDDPLSALDAGTGKKVFDRLFRPVGVNGLFSNTAVVLVTHASHFLNRVDSILVLVNGKSAFVGSWDDLAHCRPEDLNELDAIEAIRSSVQESHSEEDPVDNDAEDKTEQKYSSRKQSPDTSKGIGSHSDEEKGKIMTVEERKYGLSQISTWLKWFRYAGGVFFFGIIVITMAFDRFMYVATEWWLAQWTTGHDKPVYRFGKWYPAQTDGKSSQLDYVYTYLIILAISMVTTVLRTNWIIQGGARCASRIFVVMLSTVLYAPMSYFDTTPIGRIMNRFTYDTETLDLTLTMNMTMLMTSLGWIFTGIILQTIILPWQLIAIAFIVCMYWLLVLHYRKSAVDLQRLDATSRSPVQAQLAEAIDGTSTIRVFGKASYFSNVFRRALDENSGMMMNFMAAHRWLAVRIQVLGACSVLFSVAFVAAFNDVLNLDPGIAAILIIWSANFTISLSFFVQGISESEASMTSLERALAMTQIPQEENKLIRAEPVAESWPATGNVAFENVNLRYRPGLPLSLNGLTFSIKSGQRCGVVGRTGAGKSTLAAALFRLVELEGGRILFDGVDISKIDLSNVRGRKNGMTIIPQEPVLFPGNLKQCLDPFSDFTDEEVQEALDSVKGASRGLNDLNAIVEEGGKNFSVGERQLICLGRAMLSKPKLLFLDEATASVDGETDALIQRMLRSRFVGTTLLTIAHRLNTIMDYDVILVIDAGRCAEFGTPAELLENKEGIFSQLVESTGKESSAALRSMVHDPLDLLID